MNSPVDPISDLDLRDEITLFESLEAEFADVEVHAVRERLAGLKFRSADIGITWNREQAGIDDAVLAATGSVELAAIFTSATR